MKIISIEWQWLNCSKAFTFIEPRLLSTGGGSYSDFDNSHWWNVSKHFYIWTYCFLTIKYRKYVR